MDLGIAGRVAIVGGSSRGLGFAIAQTLAEEGVDLVLTARSAGPLKAAAEQISETTGRRVFGVEADLATEAGVQAILDVTESELGGADILVTNTGGPPPGNFSDQDIESWRSAYAGLLESVVRLTGGVVPRMRAQKWGRIVNVTSIAVKQPVDGLILSNTFRAGVTGLARTLANELAADGITVNNVMPGYTRTERLDVLAERLGQDDPGGAAGVFERWAAEIPAARLGDPSELAALVAFLCSEQSAYTTGTSIPVDGGWIRALL